VTDLLIAGARASNRDRDRSFTGHPHVVKVLDAWLRERFQPGRIYVGDATGVDWCTLCWAREHNIPCDPLEAPWADLGDAAGMLRNEWLVDAAPPGTPCLGLPYGESPGTRGCMRLALRKGLPVFCADRNGDVTPILDPCDIRLGRRLRRA